MIRKVVNLASWPVTPVKETVYLITDTKGKIVFASTYKEITSMLEQYLQGVFLQEVFNLKKWSGEKWTKTMANSSKTIFDSEFSPYIYTPYFKMFNE